VGDVSNVVFCNGAIARPTRFVHLLRVLRYRMHVAATTLERMVDYCQNTPEDPLTSSACVRQRIALIEKNLEFLKKAKTRSRQDAGVGRGFIVEARLSAP